MDHIVQAAPRLNQPLLAPLAASATAPTVSSIVPSMSGPAHANTMISAVAFNLVVPTTSGSAAASPTNLNSPVAGIQTVGVFVSAAHHADGSGGVQTVIGEAPNSSAGGSGQMIEDGASPQTGTDDPALLSILEGWDCSDNFTMRLSDILGAAGASGLQFNGTPGFAGQTVVNDEGGAALAGAAGLACFLAGRIDLVRDLRAREIVDDMAALNCSSKDDEDQRWR
jgi:hypothetical protein